MRLNILTSKDTTIKSNCGVYVIEELVRRKGLRDFLTNLFPQRSPQAQYTDSDLILGLAYSIFCGASHLEDINEVKGELDCDYLKIPSSDTIAYRCNQLSVEDHPIANPNSEVVHYFNYNEALNKNLAHLGVWLNPEWKRTPVVVDYDNTITYTGRDSKPTYKKECGYQPGVGIIDNQPVYIEGRNGNSNSPYLMEDSLQRMVAHLEEAQIKIGALRIDAAAYSKKVFQWLASRADITYYIGCRKQSIGILHDVTWHKCTWNSLEFEAASLDYSTPGEYADCRLVVYRTKNSDRQADLFWGGYTYRFILTNDWQMSASQVVICYNQRGGSERVFEYMKYDFNWNNMPFAQMKNNTTYLLITSMCYLIYKWLLKKIKYFKGIDTTIRIKKFCLFFINLAGKWIQSGRRKYLKLYTTRPYHDLLNTT